MQNRKRDTDVQNRLWTLQEKVRFQKNSIEACILSRVRQITSPGGTHETSAQAWCTGKTQRDRVERGLEWGIRMGNMCRSMTDSCQCVAKTTTILQGNWPPTNKDKWGKKKFSLLQNYKTSFYNFLEYFHHFTLKYTKLCIIWSLFCCGIVIKNTYAGCFFFFFPLEVCPVVRMTVILNVHALPIWQAIFSQ